MEHGVSHSSRVHYGERLFCHCGHRSTGYDLRTVYAAHERHVEEAKTDSR